jgi:hypothetical protein
MEAKPLLPVAQYVRMSTEDQQYSIANQEAAILTYAKSRGYVVVSTYADSGKSGIEIKHRQGLRRLLSDVMSGRARYKTILVYDVSRWGRFQDVDEAAYYEFLCKSAGIPVRYCRRCAEPAGSYSPETPCCLIILRPNPNLPQTLQPYRTETAQTTPHKANLSIVLWIILKC